MALVDMFVGVLKKEIRAKVKSHKPFILNDAFLEARAAEEKIEALNGP